MAPDNAHTEDEKELWREWAVKAQQGDKNAYGLLLRDIAPYIRNVVMRGLANPDWADDIVQEVLLSIHKSLKTYSGDRPFKPWLYAIINFRKMDFLRKHYKQRDQKQETYEQTVFSGDNVTFPDFTGELKDIEEALDSLPEKQRRVFTLMKIEGYTAQEVANEMDMSVSAVKVSAHRAVNKLRKILEE